MDKEIEEFIEALDRKLSSRLLELCSLYSDIEEYSYRFYNEEREGEE